LAREKFAKVGAENAHYQPNKKDICAELLQHSKKDRDASLSRIITSYKMWVHHYDPQTKRQLKEWYNQS
jgi:hypothetical protein